MTQKCILPKAIHPTHSQHNASAEGARKTAKFNIVLFYCMELSYSYVFFDRTDFMIFSVIRVKSLLLVAADKASLHSPVFSTDMDVSSISNDVSILFFGKR